MREQSDRELAEERFRGGFSFAVLGLVAALAEAQAYLAVDDVGWFVLAAAGVGAAMRGGLPAWLGWLGVLAGIASLATVAFLGMFAWIAVASIVMLVPRSS
jgi:hypothetical protein